MCSECLRPRVIYAQKKLSFQEVLQVERILEDVYFTCGSSLQDIDSSHGVGSTTDSRLLSKVFVRANLTCNDPVEIPFYSSKSFPDVCVHCACVGDLVENQDVYPTCNYCFKECSKIYRRKRPQFQPLASKKKKQCYLVVCGVCLCINIWLYFCMRMFLVSCLIVLLY